MKPIEFPGQNVIIAKDQPEYQPLPALVINDAEVTTITCWQFTDEEIERIVKNKCMYFKQLRFRYYSEEHKQWLPNPMQPILPMVDLSDDVELI